MSVPEDHYECSTCGQIVFMGDLAAVLFHEHQGITDRADLSGVKPGTKILSTKRCEGTCNCGVEIRTVDGRPAWEDLQKHGKRLPIDWDESEPCPMRSIEQDETSVWWRCASCDLIGPYLFHEHRCRRKAEETKGWSSGSSLCNLHLWVEVIR